jgi:Uma2 family endonuclease
MNVPPWVLTNEVPTTLPALQGPSNDGGNSKISKPGHSPTQYELPYDDGENMDTGRHGLQIDLLRTTLRPWIEARPDGFAGGNMFVYFSPAQLRNEDFKGPDFFVALGVPKGERRSWVCWDEGKNPDLVIELLSDSTAHTDKNEKKQVYERQLQVAEYYWFDPFAPDDWAGFHLQNGQYQEVFPNAQGQFISQVLQLSLVRWSGIFEGVQATWLRWAKFDGTLLPTADERAAEERQRADFAESQIFQIIRRMLAHGMTESQISVTTGLPEAKIQSLLGENEKRH